MRKRRITKRSAIEDVKLEMTPMIDVVFQLLVFFVFAIKVEDILSHLDVSRPAPDPEAQEEQVQDLLRIKVYSGGYVLRGRPISLQRLDRRLTRIASFSKNISVIIECTADSQHQRLVQLLDLCAKAGLSNLSVFSL